MKQTVVFDFDGVIHSYTSGWKGVGVIPDPPVPGIKEAIDNIRAAGYEVVVVSTRYTSAEGRIALSHYLKQHHIEVDDIRVDDVAVVLRWCVGCVAVVLRLCGSGE